ncbi:MAG: GTPase domain-containing protein [Betaproteobacteria bacterium]|jgi:predicted GTPase|nr:GTPase domain-containing protein [Betaproteobacteria bacterium]
MTDGTHEVNLSLVSHTNVGKTTLARTLLGEDVGEVRDAPHVTALAEVHTMIETSEGDALRLWDTPGFGDSVRLARRLEQSDSPLARLLSSTWDRFKDRPFWSTQQAAKNVRDHADVVLYLVNAAETPSDAAYVGPEMRVLAWIGKPTLVLLNQTGVLRPRREEEAEEARWRAHVARYNIVRDVLTLDAFARCWVQEITLLRAVAEVLPEAKRPAFARLQDAWTRRRQSQFEEAMTALATQLARAACDREVVDEAGLRLRLREVGSALGIGRGDESGPLGPAMRALAERLDADIRDATDRLIAIYGLGGHAARKVLERLAENYVVKRGLSEGKSALVGGVVTGALAGLKADLAAGGLTLGAGLLVGGLLGALGGAGLARGYNFVRGANTTSVQWSDTVLEELVAGALLRYLAVAHYGRGRGEWTERGYPEFWNEAVKAVVEARRDALSKLWVGRDADGAAEAFAPAIAEVLSAAARDLLDRLYPGSLETNA